MKNTLTVIGFIVAAMVTLAMVYFVDIPRDTSPWLNMGEKIQKVQVLAQPVQDKCKMDRLTGKLPGFQASVECSNPAIRAAFAKEGFPDMSKVDEFLKYRSEYAKMADSHQITEEEMGQQTQEALNAMLHSAASEKAK